MIRNYSKIQCGIAAAAVAATLTLAGAANGDIIVTISPQESTIFLGDSVTVDLIANIDSAEFLVAWGMDLAFDPAIVSHNPNTDVLLGGLWGPLNNPDGDGLAGIFVPDPNDPQPGASGSVVLASLTFTGIALGSTDLIGSYTDGDLFEGFAMFGGGLGNVTFVNGIIHVVDIPAPGAIALLGAFGLLGTRRRNN